MKDEQKTKAELIDELKKLRQQIGLQKSDSAKINKDPILENGEMINRAVIENSPIGISIRSSKRKLLSVNRAWKKIWNFSDEQVDELMKENPEKLNFAHTRQSLGEWLPKVENIYKEGGSLHIPRLLMTIKKFNIKCWISLTYYAINDDKGLVDRIVILTDDITERVNLENSILESESKYRSVIDNANIGIIVIQDNHIVFCNSQMYEMFGYSEVEYNKIDFLSMVHPDDRPKAVERIRVRLSGSKIDLKPLEIRAICKSGEIKWIETNSTLIQWESMPAIQAFICDITERKLAEDALSENKEKYKLLVESLKSSIINFSPDGTIIYCSPNVEELGGYCSEEEVGQHFTKYIADKADLVKLQEIFQKILKKKKSETFEFLYKPKYKDPFYVEARANPVFKQGSECMDSISCIVTDITERKQAEKEIRKFKTISDSANYGTAIVDISGHIIYINECFAEMHGLTVEETNGKQLSIFHSDKQLQDVNQINKDLIENGSYFAIEVWHKKKDGSVFPTMMSATVIKDDNNNPLYIAASAVDITERKRIEEELRESREHYKNFFDNALVGFFKTKMSDGTFIEINRKTAELLGLPANEIIGKMRSVDLYKNPDQRKILVTKLKRDGELNGTDIDMILPNGREVTLSFSVKAYPKQDYLECVVIDITERKRAEKALSESESKFRCFAENTPSIIFTINRDGKILYMNHAPEGVCLEKVIGTNMYAMIGSEFHESVKEQVKIVFDEGKSRQYEANGTGPNGSISNYLSNIGPIWGSNGEVVSAIISTQDITERKQADEELRKLAEVVKYSSELVNMSDLEGKMIFLNEAGGDMLGVDPDNVQDTNIMEVIPEKWITSVQNELLPALMSGGHWEGELQYRNVKTGKLTDVHAMAFTVKDPKTGKPQFLANVSMDITETKRLREQEFRAQRLESAGRVAGQIAHDFNNLLAPLVAYPDFIKEELPDNHPTLKYINAMEKSANQIADINQQLLTLSRRGHYNQEILNLNEVIQFAIGEIGILPQSVVIETDFAKNLMNIRGGASQINRILFNLINNARDAMQDVGNISIKTENYYADNPTTNFGHMPKGEYVKITFSDIGCGIPEDICHNIFEPFFTTKLSDKRRGSGLGLSVVDAVMKDHDGYIDLQSSVGDGTSFYLYFPITRETIDAACEDEILGGTESILVVDDDKTQCDVALMLLKKLGYNATTINSGEQAIKYLKNNPQDLLLLDMIMPDGIDGTETFRRVIQMYPNQKAIIVSGYAESSRVEEARQLGIEMYIRKPLTLKLVASCIRKVLDKKEAPVSIA